MSRLKVKEQSSSIERRSISLSLKRQQLSAMKILSVSTFRSAAAIVFLGCGNSGLRAASASSCDESIFGPPQMSNETTGPITDIEIKFKFNSDGFQMPRATWTIEPAPDGTNTTSVFMSPSDIGTVDFENWADYGIVLDPAAVANAAEVGILIQVPRDDLERVSIEYGMPFYVNIAKGFTQLTMISISGATTCNYYDGCLICDTLFTPKDINNVGPTIVADLSSVEMQVSESWGNYTQAIDISQFGAGIYDLTVVLPEDDDGVGMVLNLDPTQANIKIKGNIKCDGSYGVVTDELPNMPNEFYCGITSKPEPGAKETSTNLVVDGTISGFFNVSSNVGSAVFVEVSDDAGCDHFAPFHNAETIGSFTCQDGGDAVAVVNTEPFPCVGDTGMVDCGQYGRNYEDDICRVPLAKQPECGPLTGSGHHVAIFSSIVVSWVSAFVTLVAWF